MTEYLEEKLRALFPILFGDKKLSIMARIQTALCLFFMPKDLRNFLELLLGELEKGYNNLDDKQKEKISTLIIQLHFRE